MTKARIQALQWLHDMGEVSSFLGSPISAAMLDRMVRQGQVQWRQAGGQTWLPVWSLTDKGRRDLHEATQ